MTGFRGLTWDHPRGRDALQAAAFDGLSWDVHPLEGFESTQIDELAARYDLVGLDHPHLGDAIAAGCLRPWDEFFTTTELGRWSAAAVGASARSYQLGGSTWALPLDAATQVSARRADLLPVAPVTWAAALDVDARVAPSLAGPHAFLSFCSIAISLGGDLGDEFSDPEIAGDALEILAGLAGRAPAVTATLNPIGLLELMATTDELAYVPLVYGYVTYSPRVSFGAPPRGEKIGSTIGGTGIAITRRAAPSPQLLEHLRWLMSDDAQVGFIPAHAGQPSARSAWTDPAVDTAAGGFYSATLDTIEHAWVRPRFPGYIRFQSEASAIIREGLPDARTVGALARAYEGARA